MNHKKNYKNHWGFSLAQFLLFFPAIVWSGWVLTQLWGWFVVPLGVIPIGIWHAVALWSICSWLSGSSSVIIWLQLDKSEINQDQDDLEKKQKQDKANMKQTFIHFVSYYMIFPTIAWLFGKLYLYAMINF